MQLIKNSPDNHDQQCYFISEIDRNLYSYYQLNPEKIIRISDWKCIGLCTVCFGEIPLDHLSVTGYKITLPYDQIDNFINKIKKTSKYTCPHCKAEGESEQDGNTLKVKNIPFYIVKMRTFILEEKINFPFFWRDKIPTKYFKEICPLR